MKLEIRDMTAADMDGKAYVHWKSWQETYPGLVDAAYLANMTFEKCRQIARRWPDNIVVAVLDGKVVGFTGYGPCRNPGFDGAGEVFAIYILKEAQDLGIGRKLMDAALERLSGYRNIVIWVLKGNDHAFEFYRHYGFQFNGTEAPIMIGTANTQLQLVYHR